MKKKVIFGVVFISLIIINLTTSLHSKKDLISLVNLELLSSASAEDSEGGGETYDNKFKKEHTETTTVTVMHDENGELICVPEGTEGSWQMTATETWECCELGGIGCPTSLPDC